MLDRSHEIMLVDVIVPEDDAHDTERELAHKLELVSQELERHTSHADKRDYAFAIASGILAGAVDAMFVNSEISPKHETKAHQIAPVYTNPFERITQALDQAEQLAHAPMDTILAEVRRRMDESMSSFGDAIHSAIENEASDSALSPLFEHLCEPTPLGLALAIVLRLVRATSIPQGKKGNGISIRKDLRSFIVPATIAGFLNWMVDAGESINIDVSEESNIDANDVRELPRAMQILAVLVRDKPVIAKIAKKSDSWFMRQAKKQNPPSVSVMLLSLLEDVAEMPEFKDTEFSNGLCLAKRAQKNQYAPTFKKLFEDQGIPAPTKNDLNEQALPVLVNETVVRIGYFVRRLAEGWDGTADLNDVMWERFMPFGNRTVERMITVSSITLSTFDTIDASLAASRASVESAGNWIYASQQFVANVNFVAAGRAMVAIVREVSEEAKETELLREKRLLTEEKTELAVERLQEYKTRLAALLDEYLAERLEAFFEGFNLMDEGLAKGNANLVIGGNVVIQRVLGHEIQFTNQDEFDALMDSDDDFVL